MTVERINTVMHPQNCKTCARAVIKLKKPCCVVENEVSDGIVLNKTIVEFTLYRGCASHKPIQKKEGV